MRRRPLNFKDYPLSLKILVISNLILLSSTIYPLVKMIQKPNITLVMIILVDIIVILANFFWIRLRIRWLKEDEE